MLWKILHIFIVKSLCIIREVLYLASEELPVPLELGKICVMSIITCTSLLCCSPSTTNWLCSQWILSQWIIRFGLIIIVKLKPNIDNWNILQVPMLRICMRPGLMIHPASTPHGTLISQMEVTRLPQLLELPPNQMRFLLPVLEDNLVDWWVPKVLMVTWLRLILLSRVLSGTDVIHG